MLSRWKRGLAGILRLKVLSEVSTPPLPCVLITTLFCAATDLRDQAKKPLAKSSANRSLTKLFFLF